MPLVSSSTTLSLRASIAGRSSPPSPSLTPCAASALALASAYFSEDCSSALDGMQPTLRQVPPRLPRFSTPATGRAGPAGRDPAPGPAGQGVVAVVGQVAAPRRRISTAARSLALP